MAYCKHCEERLREDELDRAEHYCRKRGLLNIDKDDSFIVSALIGAVTDSALLGGLLGGDLIGGALGDVFDDGDLFD